MANIEYLGRKLQSSDAEERREAAVDLGRAGRQAAPFLFEAIGDNDWRVRKTAVEALVALGGDDVIAGLIARLSDHDNAGARNSAIEALVHIGDEATGALLAAIGTQDADVRKFIVDVLGDLRDPSAVPALMERLGDADENIRVSAAEALGKLRDKRAVDALLSCLTRYDQGWLDYAAAEALGEIGDERALAPLLASLGRSSLREPVLESLGKIGNVETLLPIIAGLADALRIVREVSATALFMIYKKSGSDERRRMILAVRNNIGDRAMDFLEEMIMTSAGELQKSAVAALGWAGRKSSIPKLLSLLREEDMEEPVVQALLSLDGGSAQTLLGFAGDENALVRRVVARALGEMGGADAEMTLINMLKDENGHVRSTSAESLGRLRSRKAIQPMLELLEDEYESVQEAAVGALADIGDEAMIDRLVGSFTSRDEGIRKNIAVLLGRLKTEKAIDALIFALKDEEPAVRKAVVQALGSISGPRAVRPLIHAITDDDPEVRMLAAEALAKTGVPEAADALIPLLEDEDLWVRAASARGLGKIGGDRVSGVLVDHLGRAADIFLLALVEVLGRLRPEAALPQFLKLADHSDPEVRKTVLIALSAYSGPEVRRAVLSRLSDRHWSVRKAAIEILRHRKDATAESLLSKIADEDPDGIVRQAAADALGR